ncbi:MAG: zinc ribbon domain-containing protein [Candidatus Zixiibacteriota bacterium]|nr:MAG: zinc ribbon domain-containing protein [candidate division Zixibacteria bacterium]
MPLFEYKCQECEHRFEELISGSDVQVFCPKCKSEKVARQLSVFSSSSKGGSSSDLPCGQSSCGSGFS